MISQAWKKILKEYIGEVTIAFYVECSSADRSVASG